MGLRARLALFFVAITVVPLAVAVVALRTQIDDQFEQRAEQELASVRDAASGLVLARLARAGDLATDLVMRDAGTVLDRADPTVAQAWLEAAAGQVVPGRADLAVLVGAGGQPLASLGEDTEAQALAAAVRDRVTAPGLLLEVREVYGAAAAQEDRLLGWVAAGVALDEDLLNQLVGGHGAAFATRDDVVASVGGPRTQPGAILAALPATGTLATVDLGGTRSLITSTALDEMGRQLLVLWAPVSVGGTALGIALLVLAASVLIAAGLGWILATGIVAPIRRAADVARAVAGGDLSRSLAPTGGRELADLATALNTMTGELATHIAEVERSRDQLRKSLSRLGETLSSSLDLNRTLAMVVETAMDTFEVDRGVLRLMTPERDALYVKVGRGLSELPPRVKLNEGVIGWVARTGLPVCLPRDVERVPPSAAGEVVGAQEMVVPLRGRAGVLGVLSLMRDDLTRPFTADDLGSLQTFAGQATGAIENVMLHREAQRLSLTDPLTSLWNFRYLQLQADRELESSTRFDRPMSVLIIDLDRFKSINDEHGHQVGDEVLVEVAARMRDATRVPDVVGRYGGEEFVVLLPGTDQIGAAATAERIRAAVGDVPFAVNADGEGSDVHQLQVSCSIGVATFPADGDSVAGLLRAADGAMYVAKRQGRNRVILADDPRAVT